MNQGIYFGQVVIGPAGSGKVFTGQPYSPLSANTCKTWHRPFVVTSS